MGDSRKQWNGFTLIELLIVVAIIAILAAIAVPNFLEAQTRAKVSRMRADLRSLAVAEEAYTLDWNTYTFNDLGDDQSGRYLDGFRLLTTPLAYVSSIPHDVFGEYRYKAQRRAANLELGTGNSATRQETGHPSAPSSINPKGFPADTFLITSIGPDHYDDTEASHPPGNFRLGEAQYPWSEVTDTDIGVQTLLTLIYDPTNGTVSSGQVYRVGGQKPALRPYDAFFAGGK
jgi:prepilin-type N-terminal cleavage/methylation domain-containing protein